MTPRERVLAAVRGVAVDRPPFSVWRHFFDREDAGAAALAQATVAWTQRFGLDLVKYNPRAHYHAEPWGTRFRYEGAKPALVRHAVASDEGWRRIRARSADERAFREMRHGIRLVRRSLPDVPLLMTVFTPLAVCERLAGRERLVADLRARPDDVLPALHAVAETFAGFAAASVEAGADGIFLATTVWAQRAVLDDEAYLRFGRPFDLRVLDAVAGAPLNVLHVCGEVARVLDLADYPVVALSWNVHANGNPTLAELGERVPDRVAIGGLSDAALLSSSTADVRAEVAAGLAATGGRRWIAAGGCTIPPEASAAAIDAARDALVASRVA